MIDRPEKERGSVLSTAKSYLALFRDPVVAANTRKSGFKIKDIVNREGQAVSLYIVTQPADKTRLRPLVRILINMICRVLADKMTFEKTEAKLSVLEKKSFAFCMGNQSGHRVPPAEPKVETSISCS